jgi:S-adenosylmethionine uptake transporter
MPPSPSTAYGEQHQQAMLLMVVAMLILPGIDAIAKWLSESVPAGQTAWSRFLFQTLIMLPLVARMRGPFHWSGLWIHALRGTLIALATLLFFSALRFLPIADAISIFFVEPLLLTLLSAVFLAEPVGWRRLLAVSVGLVGALIVIRPGFESFGWAAALPLGTALSFAFYLILTRRLAQREDPARMQFLAGVFGCVVMSLALGVGQLTGIAALDPIWPDAFEWALLAGLGVIATIGHLLVVHAFRRAPAGILAPFQYLEIVSATLLGLIFFDDFPDPMTWLGVLIIVSAGLYVFHRERVRAGP